tara:strand:+ start:436 stop:714 length:279 start_codon:yes stop_codon:yes gene_type:complete
MCVGSGGGGNDRPKRPRPKRPVEEISEWTGGPLGIGGSDGGPFIPPPPNWYDMELGEQREWMDEHYPAGTPHFFDLMVHGNSGYPNQGPFPI